MTSAGNNFNVFPENQLTRLVGWLELTSLFSTNTAGYIRDEINLPSVVQINGLYY